jgi:hypothetical protein
MIDACFPIARDLLRFPFETQVLKTQALREWANGLDPGRDSVARRLVGNAEHAGNKREWTGSVKKKLQPQLGKRQQSWQV